MCASWHRPSQNLGNIFLLNVVCGGRWGVTFCRRAGQGGMDEVYTVREVGRCHMSQFYPLESVIV